MQVMKLHLGDLKEHAAGGRSSFAGEGEGLGMVYLLAGDMQEYAVGTIAHYCWQAK
jgi:hypothetical protein